MLRQHGILPSVTIKELEEHRELLYDVLTYNRIWADVPLVEDMMNG